MRQGTLLGSLGLALAFALLVATGVFAQVAGTDQSLFSTSSATITLTDSGLSISPSQLNPGPVMFTVVNNSDRARGVYISGEDSSGTPILRYSSRIMPGNSTRMSFFLYQGKEYAFRDFTSRRVVGSDTMFTSSYSHRLTVPVLFPVGRGPSFDRDSLEISINDSDISVSSSEVDLGPVIFTVHNRSDIARGVVITGEDRTGSDVIRYTRLIRPGASTRINFWLYEGKTYTIRDYTSRRTVGGDLMFRSHFSTTITVRPGSAMGS
jgi:hypothetical protein